MKKYDISFIGTVGVPNNYGGFETLIDNLLDHLGNFSILVVCSSKAYSKSERKKRYKKSFLKYLPFKANGIQSIVYDSCSLILAGINSRNIILLGVSGALLLPLYRIFFKNNLIINIDGLEWRRNKWGKFTKIFLKISEKIAIKYCDHIIVDNQELADYVKKNYGEVRTSLIAYGGDHINLNNRGETNIKIVDDFQFLGIGRIEPENNIHIILEAFKKTNENLIYIGNWENSKYGQLLRKEYCDCTNITMLDPVYNQEKLNEYRRKAKYYVHGHSAGGSNPSLIEAMFYSIPILAFNCNFNKYTTFNKVHYWKNSKELIKAITSKEDLHFNKELVELAKSHYSWNQIAQKYVNLLN